MNPVCRDSLAPFAGQRVGFEGKVSRFSSRTGRQRTVCLYDLRCGDLELDHAWLDYTDEMYALDVGYGDTVCFTARIVPYQKALGTDYVLEDVRVDAVR